MVRIPSTVRWVESTILIQSSYTFVQFVQFLALEKIIINELMGIIESYLYQQN